MPAWPLLCFCKETNLLVTVYLGLESRTFDKTFMNHQYRWAVSRSFAYERTAKFMREICKEHCLRLKDINKNVTGCQFKYPYARVDADRFVESANYEDCVFFKGEDIAHLQDQGDTRGIDPNFSCLVLDQYLYDINTDGAFVHVKISEPTDDSIKKSEYTKINWVDRQTGHKFQRNYQNTISWVLLR